MRFEKRVPFGGLHFFLSVIGDTVDKMLTHKPPTKAVWLVNFMYNFKAFRPSLQLSAGHGCVKNDEIYDY